MRRLLFVTAAAVMQTADAFDTKPPFFDDVCTRARFNYDKCLRAVSGTTRMHIWMSDYFKEHPKPSTKLTVAEDYVDDAHALAQYRIVKVNAVGRVFLFGFGKSFQKAIDYYHDSSRSGTIMSFALAYVFVSGKDHLNTLDVGALVVAATGNNGAKKPEQTITGDDLRSPFTLLAGGYSLRNWILDCGGGKSCEFERNASANHCSDTGESICVMGVWDINGRDKSGRHAGWLPGGTSIATSHISGVVELLTQFLQHYPFAFRERLSDVQALILATALVKSCAVDMGERGIDAETGLGRLSLDCMNDDQDIDGFRQNPMALIKDRFLIVPPQFATTPVMAETSAAVSVLPLSATEVRVAAWSEAEYSWSDRKNRADLVSRFLINGKESTLTASFSEDVPFSSTGRLSSTVTVTVEYGTKSGQAVLNVSEPHTPSTKTLEVAPSVTAELNLASSLSDSALVSTLTASVKKMKPKPIRLRIKVYLEGALAH